MKIGIDIDGVLTDEHRYIIDYGTNYFNKNNIQYIIHKDIYDSEKIFEVTEEQYKEFWKENLFKYAKEICIRPFASEVINKLKMNNNQIYIITSRLFTTYDNKYKEQMQLIVKQWLHQNNIKYDDIIFCKNKLEVCKKLNIDVMIEDKPENIQSISKYIPVICYDNPYNEKIINNNIIRCYSWSDIYIKIERMIRRRIRK